MEWPTNNVSYKILYAFTDLDEKMKSISKATLKAIPQDVSYLDATYTSSLYWATATATSTGYGDVRAYTTNEKLFSIVAMLAGKLTLCF